MITKNSVNYTSLFEKATKLLKEYAGQSSDFEINNIDEYFQHIKTLAAIENHDNENLVIDVPDNVYIDPIYTILPIEEELFEINANTREIKIPKHFATHGVGVEGDEIAEIIYFSIDRYFDAIDLADMEILIQWSRAGDDLSENLDLTYKRSLEYSSGQIIFGWPVSGEMTKEPGNINFAVRFYRIGNNNKLQYSFSTKTATIKIQKGLDFKLNRDSIAAADDYRNQIYTTLKNSSSPVKGYTVAEPEFIEYALKENGKKDFENTTILTADIPCSFRVRANINPESLNKGEKMGIGGLKYEWWYKDENGSTSKLSGDDIIQNFYKSVTPSELFENEYYYYIDEKGNYSIYTSLSGEQDLYQKYSILIPDKAGQYFAKAVNTYNFDEVAKGESQVWEIPYPAAPTLSTEYNKLYRLDYKGSVDLTINTSENNDLDGEKLYQWYKNNTLIEGAVNSSISVSEEGNYSLEIINKRNNVQKAVVSEPIKVLYNPTNNFKVTPEYGTTIELELANNPTLQVTVSIPEDEKGTPVYLWYKYNNAAWEPLETDATLATYTPTSLGMYRCRVNTVYENLTSSTSNYSATFTIK